MPPATEDAGDENDGGSSGFVPPDVGFSVGLRAGYAVPFGLANGAPLNSVLGGAVPIGVDVGWFFSRHAYVGVYFLYAFGIGAGQTNDTCSAVDQECSASMVRLGAVARYHFLPTKMWDPWVGAGLGYETILLNATSDVDSSTLESGALRGIDLTLEAGLDLKPLSYLGIGPYVELATGTYFGTDSFGVHSWLSFGLRFRTNL